jgi:hypothetical protein
MTRPLPSSSNPGPTNTPSWRKRVEIAPPQEPPLQQFGVEPVGLGINPAPILSSKSEYTIETEAGAPFEVRPLNFSNGEVEAAHVAAFESQPLRKTAGRCLLGCDCEHVR